ncbi:centromere-associated protein E-like isoform X2 [Palaemon carinicauda]|uniref:centromere-associated protein E-like isoform X2 n=1 Tax=Palaemon carinicauda TaxID=392227 RepID=UPI0035B5B305
MAEDPSESDLVRFCFYEMKKRIKDSLGLTSEDVDELLSKFSETALARRKREIKPIAALSVLDDETPEKAPKPAENPLSSLSDAGINHMAATFGNSAFDESKIADVLGLDSSDLDELTSTFIQSARERKAAAAAGKAAESRYKKETVKEQPPKRPGAAVADAAVANIPVQFDTRKEEILTLTEDGVRKLYEEIIEGSITLQVVFSATYDGMCYLRLSDGQCVSPIVAVALCPESKKLKVGVVIEVKKTRLETSQKKKYDANNILRDQILLHLVITDFAYVAERKSVRRLLGSLDTSLSYRSALSHVAPILKKRNPHFRFTERNFLINNVKADKIYRKGTVCYGLKNRERSVEYYEYAKSVYPYDHRYWYNASRAYYELEVYERAEEEAVGALKMNPFEMNVYTAAGNAAMMRGMYEEALEYAFSGQFMCGDSNDHFNLICDIQKKMGEKVGEENYNFKDEFLKTYIKQVYTSGAVDINMCEELCERRDAALREAKQKQELSRMQGETLEMNRRSKNLYHETLREARRLYEAKVFSQASEKFGKALAYVTPNGDSTAIKGYSGRQEIQELQFIIAACKIRGNNVLEGMSAMKFFVSDNNAVGANASAHFFLGLGYKKTCIAKLMLHEYLECSSALKHEEQKSFKWPESNDIFPESDPEQLKNFNEELCNGCDLDFDPHRSVEVWLSLPVDHRIPEHSYKGMEYSRLVTYMENLIKETVEGLRHHVNLIGRPSDIKPIPRAICRYSNCITGKQIYETNPDFKGFVDILCEEACVFTYHTSCWEGFKRSEEYAGNNSDKDFMGSKCFAPDCAGKINGILIYDETSTLRQEIGANTRSKHNFGAKQKKKKKKNKSKQTKSHVVKDTKDSICENISEDFAHIEKTTPNSRDADDDESQCSSNDHQENTEGKNKKKPKQGKSEIKDTEDSKCENISEDFSLTEETVPISWDADDTESQCSSNDHQNNTEEKAQVPVNSLPIETESLDQVEEDNWTLKNSSKKKKNKKQKEVVELDLGSPLDTDESNKNEYAARLKLLKQQKETHETDESKVPKSTGNSFPRVCPLDKSDLLDPENPFYMPQHLRDNPKELEKVLKAKKKTSSSSFGSNTKTTLFNDRKKGKKRSYPLDDEGSNSSSAIPHQVDSGMLSHSSQNTTYPINSAVEKHEAKSVGDDSDLNSAEIEKRETQVNQDSHSKGVPKELLDRKLTENQSSLKHPLNQDFREQRELKGIAKMSCNNSDPLRWLFAVMAAFSLMILEIIGLFRPYWLAIQVSASLESTPETVHESQTSNNLKEENKRSEGSEDDTGWVCNDNSKDKDKKPVQELVLQKDVDGKTDDIAVISQNCDNSTHNIEESREISIIQAAVDGSVDTIANNSESGDDDTLKIEEPRQNSVVQKDIDGSTKTIASTSQSGNDNAFEVEVPAQKSVVQNAVDDTPTTNTTAINNQSGLDEDHKVGETKHESSINEIVGDSPKTIVSTSQNSDDNTYEVQEPALKSAVQKAVDDSPTTNTTAVNSQSGLDEDHKVGKTEHESSANEIVDDSPKTIVSTSQTCDDNTYEVEEPALKSVVQKAVDDMPTTKTTAINSQSGLDEDHKVGKPKHESSVNKTVDSSPKANSSQSRHDVQKSKQLLAGLKGVVSVNSQSGDDDTHEVEGSKYELVVLKVTDVGPNTLAISSERYEVKTAQRQSKHKTPKDSPLQSCQSPDDQCSREEGQEDEEIKEISDAGKENKEAISSEETGKVKDSMEKLLEENKDLKFELIRQGCRKELEIKLLKQEIKEEKDEKKELENEKQSLAMAREREVRKLKAEMSEMQEKIKAIQNRQGSLEREKQSLAMARENEVRKLKTEISEMQKGKKALQTRQGSLEGKYQSSVRRIEELDVRLTEERQRSTVLEAEVNWLKESLSSSARCAHEAEVKYLCVKRDIAELFLNRTIDRLTCEGDHLKKLLQYASEDSVPDLATLSKTIEEWFAHIRTLQGQRSQFLEESNHLINLVTQKEPLNGLPQDIVIPDIPNISVVPLFTIAPNSKKQLVQPSAPESQMVPMTLAGPSAHSGGAIPKGNTVSNPKPVVITGADKAVVFSYPDSHKLFVGKIPRECTESDIQSLFTDLFGEVVAVTLYDKGVTPNGRTIPKYGFVTFYDAEAQEKALGYGPLWIGNCQLNIQPRKPKYPVEGSYSDGSRYEGYNSVEYIPKIPDKPNFKPSVSGNISGIPPSRQVCSQLGQPVNDSGETRSDTVTTTTLENDDIAAYKRLIGICKQHMGKEYTLPEICSALREVRMKSTNNISEMSIDQIIESVRQQLRARKLVMP